MMVRVGGLGLSIFRSWPPIAAPSSCTREAARRVSGGWNVGTWNARIPLLHEAKRTQQRAICQTDREAIESAIQMKGRLSVEIWDGIRLVIGLKSTDDR
jgi:hypothetical protein